VVAASEGIVVGYDGSPSADQALRWAAWEALERRAALTVCVAWAPEYLAMLDEASAYDLAERKANEILAPGVAYARSVLGPGAVRPMLAGGSAVSVLCELSVTADMVVVGPRGQGGVTGLPLGSVAAEVAAYGRGAVVMIRGQWKIADHPPGPVVVGVDESSESRRVTEFAFSEAQLHKAPLLAVCAVADSPEILGGARALEAEFSQAMTLREKEHPNLIVQRQIAQASPRTALLAAATGAQMLVVGCRGRGGIQGMKLGSVAQAMLQYAPCPVAVIHPAGDVDATGR